MASHPSPFSLRPWPIGDKKPKNLAEFIARVNAQPGGFRNLTEAKLRERIAAEENGNAEAEGSSEEDEEEEEDTSADKSKTVAAAREEFLKNIEFAHQSAMLSVDFVSLLLSKYEPKALGTLSAALRERVGFGTLGASEIKDSNVTEARKQDDLAVATGWRLIGINNMVDSVVAAAERLEKEMELEAKYWADILAVSENGWSVCALPNEQHTLGVRFGFSESAADFRNSSIAPLRRNDDGTVRLEIGRIGGGSQRVRATTKKNGVIVDQSPLPGRTPDDAPLQDRVLEARNTAFHQELWYEINREARTLLSADVYSNSSSITWKQDSQTEVIFTLEDLAEPDNSNERLSDINCSCTAYYVYMQFLLFQGHRQNYYKRTTATQPAPNRMLTLQSYTIIRAIIASTQYFKGCKAIADFLEELVFILQRAGVMTAACKSTAQSPTAGLPQGNSTRHGPKMELNFITQLVARLESTFELTITPEAKIYVRARIVPGPSIGMLVVISLTPFTPQNGGESNTTTSNVPSNTDDKDKQPPNPLEDVYPPSDPREPYPNATETIYYIRQATIYALAHRLASDATKALQRDGIQWTVTPRGLSVVDLDEREARIDITQDANGRLALSLDAQWPEGKAVKSQRWMWSAGYSNAVSTKSLGDHVLRIMRGDGVVG
ncbi:subunit 17 of mediator complex-domain-containing protein [Hypomontagnella monticulosa]|nr:subunit 17 of mediator complex-domain-containing protein [Hypomontagnella monticulosa]